MKQIIRERNTSSDGEEDTVVTFSSKRIKTAKSNPNMQSTIKKKHSAPISDCIKKPVKICKDYEENGFKETCKFLNDRHREGQYHRSSGENVFIRSTVSWDYQPDVCKDFKETGFCGFGDKCKFLHDRGDHKHGWEFEMANNKENDDTKYQIKSDKNNLSFHMCFICRKSSVELVVTNCQHEFCEKCILKQLKKSTLCYCCGKQTSGLFKSVKFKSL